MKNAKPNQANSRSVRNKYLRGMLVPTQTHAAVKEIALKHGRLLWNITNEFIIRGMAEYLKEQHPVEPYIDSKAFYRTE